MSEFFKNLYTNFILRDILAKAVPGFLVLAYIFHGKMPIVHSIQGFLEIVVIVLIYGLSFMTGMLLQFLGTLKIPRTNWSIIKIYVHKNNQVISLKKLEEFLSATKGSEVIRSQRERFVILKNMAGTYAVSLLAILLVEFAKYLAIVLHPFPMPIAVASLIFFALMCQNRFHGNEQRNWEKMVIRRNKQEEGKKKG